MFCEMNFQVGLNVMGHMIAGELGFTLDKLEIEMDGNLNPARLFGKSFTDRAGFKNIQVKLKPYAAITPALLEKWVQEVESRCPVNDNLLNKTPIEVKVLYPN
jgi:uncharacterized OsmC-like protein